MKIIVPTILKVSIINTMNSIIIITGDNVEFVVGMNIITKFIKTLANMIEDIGHDETTKIPLPTISSEAFIKILEWCDHHQDTVFEHEEIKDGDNRPHKFDNWDMAFFLNMYDGIHVEPDRPINAMNRHAVDCVLALDFATQKKTDFKILNIINFSNYLDIDELVNVGCLFFSRLLSKFTFDITNIDGITDFVQQDQIIREKFIERFGEIYGITDDLDMETKQRLASECQWIYTNVDDLYTLIENPDGSEKDIFEEMRLMKNRQDAEP